MKKYFIEADGGKHGPYDKYELKDIGIGAGTLLSSENEEGVYKAKDYPELLHILEKNPKKKIDFEKDRFFGYKLADDSSRTALHFKSSFLFLPFTILIVVLSFLLNINPKKGSFTAFVFIVSIIIITAVYKIYFIIKYSSPIGIKNSKLKLISSKDGKFIHEIARTDFNRAFNIALKYSFLPDRWNFRLSETRNPQTFSEKISEVYLIVDERKTYNY